MCSTGGRETLRIGDLWNNTESGVGIAREQMGSYSKTSPGGTLSIAESKSNDIGHYSDNRSTDTDHCGNGQSNATTNWASGIQLGKPNSPGVSALKPFNHSGEGAVNPIYGITSCISTGQPQRLWGL